MGITRPSYIKDYVSEDACMSFIALEAGVWRAIRLRRPVEDVKRIIDDLLDDYPSEYAEVKANVEFSLRRVLRDYTILMTKCKSILADVDTQMRKTVLMVMFKKVSRVHYNAMHAAANDVHDYLENWNMDVTEARNALDNLHRTADNFFNQHETMWTAFVRLVRSILPDHDPKTVNASSKLPLPTDMGYDKLGDMIGPGKILTHMTWADVEDLRIMFA